MGAFSAISSSESSPRAEVHDRDFAFFFLGTDSADQAGEAFVPTLTRCLGSPLHIAISLGEFCADLFRTGRIRASTGSRFLRLASLPVVT